MFNHEEDLQYFRERAKIVTGTKKEVCDKCIKLLEEAQFIYTKQKQKV